MTVQPGLCGTCSETTLLVFPRGGSFAFSFRVVVMATGLYSFKWMAAYEEDKQRIKMKKRQAEERQRRKELTIDL